jgi:hypothetical protein
VKSEIDRAFSLGKVIIPFRVENVEIDKGLAYYLAKTHWLDAVTRPLEQHIDRLAGTIRQVAGMEPVPISEMPQPPAPPAPSGGSTKTPWIIAGIAVVLCALIAIGGLLFVWLNQRKSETTQAATAPSQPALAKTTPVPSSSSSSSATEWETADSSSTAPASDADPFAGRWKIAGAATLAGESYGGTVEITRTGSRYSIQWNAAGSEYNGIALGVGNKLCAAFGSGDFSVIYYRIGQDGTLRGRWASSNFAANDRDAFENATAHAGGRLEGKYTLKGLNSDGTDYQGKLDIVKTGQTFQLEWQVLGTTSKGVGIKVDDGLFVASGDKTPLGVVGYTFDGARAKGVWTLAGEEVVAKENLAK